MVFVIVAVLITALAVFNRYLVVQMSQEHQMTKKQDLALLICTVLAMLWAYKQFGMTATALFYVILWEMLIIVGWIDYFTHTIVEGLVYIPTACLGLLLWLLDKPLLQHILGGLLGFGLYFVLYTVAKWYYKQEAFGFGDVILMGAIGFAIGLDLTFLTAMLAFYLALIGIIILKIVGRSITGKLVLAFGPYICLSAFITSLYGHHMLLYYYRLFI